MNSYIFILVNLFSVTIVGQDKSIEFSVSGMESSYIRKSDGTNWQEEGPKMSNGFSAKFSADLLLDDDSTSSKVFVLGMESWYSDNSVFVTSYSYRDNGSIIRSSTSGIIDISQVAVGGRIGAMFQNRKKSFYTQVLLLPQYFFKSKYAGSLNTNWSVDYYQIDSLATGYYSEEVDDRYENEGYMMNMELKIGGRVNFGNGKYIGVFVFAKARQRKWNRMDFKQRQRIGAGISYMI